MGLFDNLVAKVKNPGLDKPVEAKRKSRFIGELSIEN
jgi:hypothetical protein